VGYVDGNLDAEGRIKAAAERDQRIYMIISGYMSALFLPPRLIARGSSNPRPVDFEPLTPPLSAPQPRPSAHYALLCELVGGTGERRSHWGGRPAGRALELSAWENPRYLAVHLFLTVPSGGGSEERHTTTMPNTAHLQTTPVG